MNTVPRQPSSSVSPGDVIAQFFIVVLVIVAVTFSDPLIYIALPKELVTLVLQSSIVLFFIVKVAGVFPSIQIAAPTFPVERLIVTFSKEVVVDFPSVVLSYALNAGAVASEFPASSIITFFNSILPPPAFHTAVHPLRELLSIIIGWSADVPCILRVPLF